MAMHLFHTKDHVGSSPIPTIKVLSPKMSH